MLKQSDNQMFWGQCKGTVHFSIIWLTNYSASKAKIKQVYKSILNKLTLTKCNKKNKKDNSRNIGSHTNV